MLKRLFSSLGGGAEHEEPGGSTGSFHRLGWVAADQNPYGVRMVDCRSLTRTLPANSDEPQVAARFLELRRADGEAYRDRSPNNSQDVSCALSYPSRVGGDGPIHLCRVMEDKWDVFELGPSWVFASSWTGDLVYRVLRTPDHDGVSVHRVEFDADRVSEGPEFALRQADFLVKHLLYDWQGPHPIPPGFSQDLRSIAEYSFEAYGRRGSFATFEDTLPLRP